MIIIVFTFQRSDSNFNEILEKLKYFRDKVNSRSTKMNNKPQKMKSFIVVISTPIFYRRRSILCVFRETYTLFYCISFHFILFHFISTSFPLCFRRTLPLLFTEWWTVIWLYIFPFLWWFLLYIYTCASLVLHYMFKRILILNGQPTLNLKRNSKKK